jgi:hypothetical protein
MGIICKTCEYTNTEIYNQERNGSQPNHRGIIYPKDFVESMSIKENEEKEKEENKVKEEKGEKEENEENEEKEETIFKFDHDDDEKEEEKCLKTILKKGNSNHKFKKYEKSISFHFENRDKDIVEKTVKIIENKQHKLDQGIKRKKYKNKTVNQPKKSINGNNQNDSNLNTNFSDEIWFRRKKKSTTLMENSKMLQQFFLAEMKVPISHEILVPQKKGNPSEKYIRGKQIGKGTFGNVYESKNLIFNNKVAMKVIPKNEHMDQLLLKNEILILKKLSHPNIVRIYEFYESYNCYYLINEFCSGGELFNYINNSKLYEQQLSIIFYQVF